MRSGFPPQYLPRATVLLDLGEKIIAVEIDGRDAAIQAEVSYERPFQDTYFMSPTRAYLPEPGILTVTVGAHQRAGAERHYVVRELPRWPDLGADPRCPARLMPALGLTLRCERWRGHHLEDGVLEHAAGPTTWRDDDVRSLAPAAQAA